MAPGSRTIVRNLAAGADSPWRTGQVLLKNIDGGSQLVAIAETLSWLASSMAYLTICQPPWRCTSTVTGM
jgi:hypothetical protein